MKNIKFIEWCDLYIEYARKIFRLPVYEHCSDNRIKITLKDLFNVYGL